MKLNNYSLVADFQKWKQRKEAQAADKGDWAMAVKNKDKAKAGSSSMGSKAVEVVKKENLQMKKNNSF